MKATIDKYKLESAERVFAVSNTPSFLLRKLREDQGVRRLAEDYSPSQMLSGLKRSLKKKPKNLGDVVRPYAILVGLSWYSDRTPLRLAQKLIAPHHPWFDELSNDLVNRHSPIHYVDLKVPVRLPLALSGNAE